MKTADFILNERILIVFLVIILFIISLKKLTLILY